MDESTKPPQTKVSEYLDLLNPSSEHMVTFSPFFTNQMSVELIRSMTVIRRARVLYICIGRPHIFVQKMLMNRGINIKDIYFMDMVLHVCREGGRSKAPVIHVPDSKEPLELPTVFKLYRVDQELSSLSLDDIELMVLDNVSELRTYNSDQQIRTFLGLLHGLSQKTGKGLILLHLDNRPNDGMRELAEGMSIHTLAIPAKAFQ